MKRLLLWRLTGFGWGVLVLAIVSRSVTNLVLSLFGFFKNTMSNCKLHPSRRSFLRAGLAAGSYQYYAIPQYLVAAFEIAQPREALLLSLSVALSARY